MMEFRGLEMDSNRIWDEDSTRKALEFMQEGGLNALIFHQVDIIDDLVLPEEYYGPPSIVPGKWPARPLFVRRRNQRNHIPYMRHVAKLAHSKGIQLFLEVKEPTYPEPLLYVHPELIGKNGEICPSNPFWFDFVRAKVRDVLERVPELDGIIDSLSSVETKVSPLFNACECSRCRSMDPKRWYGDMISAIHSPLKERGKKLCIRDFSYGPAEQAVLTDVIAQMPRDIMVALKNTPHDCYPTFPNNPKIGTIENHSEVIEFDAWGQYFGLGVFPCILLSDFKNRAEHVRSRGAVGYFCRIDWEGVTGGWTLNSLNLINLYGLAKLMDNPTCSFESIIDESLKLLSSLDSRIPFLGSVFKVESSSELTEIAGILLKTWPIIKKSLYIKDTLFQHNSIYLGSLTEAREMRGKIHPLKPWAPDREDPFENLGREGLEEVLSEKSEALREVQGIVGSLRDRKVGLSSRSREALLSLFEAFEFYVEGFYRSGRAYSLTEYALATKDASDSRAAAVALNDLKDYGERLERLSSYYLHEPDSHIIRMLLDHEKALNLYRGLRETLA